MAPAAAVAAAIFAGTAFAGGSLPLSVPMALVGLFTASCAAGLARQLSDAGSMAASGARGLHPGAGFPAGWGYACEAAVGPPLLPRSSFTTVGTRHEDGVAVRCAMNTVVIAERLKGVETLRPRLESDSHLISTGSARPLEDAFRISQLGLVRWLVCDDFSELYAYQFATQAVESPLAHVRDTDYACVAKLRKEWLPAWQTHRGRQTQRKEVTAMLTR